MSILRQQVETNEKPPDALPDYTPLDVSISEFLAPFYPDVNEEIRGRTFAPKGAPEDDPRFSAFKFSICLLYTSPSPRDRTRSRMPSSA